MPRPRMDAYERKDAEEGEDLAALSEKLTQDLRSHIHLIADCPVLSDDWIRMADLVGRIAVVSEMEAKLPKQSANATLWETEELALRYVMEDGKLNLCLRCLIEFREYQRQGSRGTRGDACVPWLKPGETSDAETIFKLDKLDRFEKGMGIMLRNAWLHIEAVQTTELPLLLRHIGEVLNEAVNEELGRMRVSHYAKNTKDIHERQEVLILHYLKGLCVHIEEIATLRFMKIIESENIIVHLVDFLDMHHDKIKSRDLLTGVQALSELIDSEDFQTYEDKFIQPAGQAKMSKFRDLFLEKFCSDYDERRTIQPLLRYVADLEYEHK